MRSLGFLSAILTGVAVHAGCGSDSEPATGCTGSCAGTSSDAQADESTSGGTGGTGGTGGSSGTGGSAGASATGGSAGTADAGADSGGDAEAGVSCSPCSGYAPPAPAGNVVNPAVVELSGLSASRLRPGVFYAHNDSGDSARFFAFDGSGNTIGEFRLQGVTAADWEDMAIGPCPAGSCLFFGDIGDNNQQRASIGIVRVTEPDVAVGSNVGTVDVSYDRFEYSYQPGPQNAETLLAHPVTGNLYIVTKSTSGTSLVFRIDAPTSPGTPQTLPQLTEFALPASGGPLATGGAIHPCGDRFLLRTYDALFEYVAPASAPFESAFAATPQPLPAASEAQGEAVTYLSDGRGYATASEGQSPPLNVARCQ